MSQQLFIQKAAQLLSKLTTVAKGGSTLVFEQVSINANSSRNYDLTELLVNHAEYDLRSARVSAWILDDDDGGPTEGYLIGGEARLTCGVKADGSVRVHLHHNTATTVLIRIDHPSVRIP